MENLSKIELAGKYEGIDIIIKKIAYSTPHLEDVKIDGHFFCINPRNGTRMTEELAVFAYNKIVDFCVPRRKKKEVLKKIYETQDTRHLVQLTDAAKNTIINATKSIKTSGESGEILLFAILEHFLGAPLIANKMYLKTNQQMPVHGADGIHALINDNKISLLWGESKMYQQFSQAAESVCDSIKKFVDPVGGPQIDREFRIIEEYADFGDDNLKNLFLEYFNPYNEKYLKSQERFCCFIGFDYIECLNCDDEDEFVKKYQQRINKACLLLKDKIIEHKISNLDFMFLLLPFDSVERFRTCFYSRLG